MAVDLSRVGKRETLPPLPNRKAYWQRLRPGCFVGYRPSTKGGAGSWAARAYDEEQRAYRLQGAGKFRRPALLPNVSRLPSRRRKPSRPRSSEAALPTKRLKPSRMPAAGWQRRTTRRARASRRYVYSDPIAKVKLAKLRRSHVDGWRERLEATPALGFEKQERRARHAARAPPPPSTATWRCFGRRWQGAGAGRAEHRSGMAGGAEADQERREAADAVSGPRATSGPAGCH